MKKLRLESCSELKDLTPLAECKDLEGLVLPSQCKGKSIEYLRLPALLQQAGNTQTGNLPNHVERGKPQASRLRIQMGQYAHGRGILEKTRRRRGEEVRGQ
ncbi:MAG: hypothetical protein HY360_25670 [Verrucomicrobia bacterium]|nr:hypothetical protein [Verrucomicrobiota bacterium]